MKSILVVDDNKTNLMSAKTALSDDYKVIAVTQGAQALKYLESNTCDLILLDIDMPDMNGFEVMDAIKATHPANDTPVLFITGNTDPETIGKAIECGGMDVVLKPFVKALLLSRIAYLLELVELRKK
ncbi:MAG: response regulator [Lachnospiraceae bacterium]|nr:response regulator [Lachnospiraceae bacterium]